MSGINYQDIDTPWQPQPIAWREGTPVEIKDELRRLAETEETHLVREVTVREPGFTPPHSEDKRDRVEYLISRAMEEFRLLETCGLYAPSTEWHTFLDSDGYLRTLARVAVIDGEELGYMLMRELDELSGVDRAAYFERLERVQAYADLPERGGRRRLPDAKRLFNYRLGEPKDDSIERPEGPGPWMYLHDIEPDFWVRRP